MSKERLMRGVVCASLLLAASFVLWGRAARTSAQGPPAGDKPVEQTRKNIQVLKGLPESQLLPEMNFIAASLGVQCNFCHVNKGRDPQTGQTQWVWESDEKEEKRIAREMMRMVLTISKGDFGLSRGQVTCYTCHRGQDHPQTLPTLPLAAPSPRPGPPGGGPAGAPGATVPGAAAAPRPEQPTVQQVFDKYVAAVGKPEAVRQFQTQVLKGTAAGVRGSQSFELTLKAPDKMLLVVEGGQGGGPLRRAFSGAAGWMTGPRGPRALGASEVVEARRNADIFNVVKFAPAETMRVAGRRKVGERDAIVVVDRQSETLQRRYFFDAETGLLLRVVTLTDAILNQIPEQVDFEDYRDVDGVKVPFTVRISSVVPVNSQTLTVTEAKHGVPVEDTLFDMPKPQ